MDEIIIKLVTERVHEICDELCGIFCYLPTKRTTNMMEQGSSFIIDHQSSNERQASIGHRCSAKDRQRATKAESLVSEPMTHIKLCAYRIDDKNI
jgi:hypothetical protein